MKLRRVLVFLLALTLICSVSGSLTDVQAATKKKKTGVTCEALDGAKLNKALSTCSDVTKAPTSALLVKGYGGKGCIKITANEDGVLVLNPTNASADNIVMSVYSDSTMRNKPWGISSGKWIQADAITGDGEHIISLPMCAGDSYYVTCVGKSKMLTKETMDIKGGFVPDSKSILADIKIGYYNKYKHTLTMNFVVKKDFMKANPDFDTFDARVKWDYNTLAADNKLIASGHTFSCDDSSTRAEITFKKDDSYGSTAGTPFYFCTSGIDADKSNNLTIYIGYLHKTVWGVQRVNVDLRRWQTKFEDDVVDIPIAAVAGTNIIVGKAPSSWDVVCVKIGGKEYTQKADAQGYYGIKLKSNLKKGGKFSVYLMEMDFLATECNVQDEFPVGYAE